jgi:hypothetical protein
MFMLLLSSLQSRVSHSFFSFWIKQEDEEVWEEVEEMKGEKYCHFSSCHIIHSLVPQTH